MKYKVSGQKIEPFISFGKMSMVKGFLDRKNFRHNSKKWISHVK